MTSEPTVWAFLGVVLLVALSYYVGYVVIFLYLYLAAASDSPRRGRLTRRLFPSVARRVERELRSLGSGKVLEAEPRSRHRVRSLWRLALLLLSAVTGMSLLAWVAIRFFGLGR